MYMVKRMPLNDDQFRQIMVRGNANEDGDIEDQYKDRQIQGGDKPVSCQAALNHGGNGQAVTRDLSASQKQLVNDGVETNMTTKKGKQLVMIKRKQSSMAYKDSVNKLTKEWSIEGTL